MRMKSLRGDTSLLVMALIALPLLVSQGCGGEKKDVAIAGSSIQVSPSSYSQAGIAGDLSVDFTVTVKYPDGTPYPKANIYITGPFAVPRNLAGSAARYQFYYGPGGELGPNGNNPALAQPVNSGFTAQTDDAGNYTFSITIFGTVGGSANLFTDNIQVKSGAASAIVAVTIS